MALVECPECLEKISDSAPACPHCGFKSATASKPKADAGAILKQGCLGLVMVAMGGCGVACMFNLKSCADAPVTASAPAVSAPAAPPQSVIPSAVAQVTPQNEDIAALSEIHKTLIHLEGELSQRGEQLKNVITQGVISNGDMSPDDAINLGSVMSQYPGFLKSELSKVEAIKQPKFNSAIAGTHVRGALDTLAHNLRLQKSKFKALTNGDLDRAAVINGQCEQLDIEEATHLIKAYEVLGVPLAKVNTAKGGVLP